MASIIDTQIHEGWASRSWGWSGEVNLAVNVELAREAMDSVGVDVSVINARDDFLDLAVQAYPDRFFAAASVREPVADAEGFVAEYRRKPNRVALRISPVDWRTGRLDAAYESGALESVIRAAELAEIPLFLFTPGFPETAASIARGHPDLAIIVDHLGLRQPPPLQSSDPWEPLARVIALAELPNVAIKFSGGLTLSAESFPHRDVWPRLMNLLDAFGCDRLMWASDYTRMRLAPGSLEPAPRADWVTTYLDCVCFVRDTDQLSHNEKRALLGDTARRILRMPEVPPRHSIAE
jgi:L-fuconolactonase